VVIDDGSAEGTIVGDIEVGKEDVGVTDKGAGVYLVTGEIEESGRHDEGVRATEDCDRCRGEV